MSCFVDPSISGNTGGCAQLRLASGVEQSKARATPWSQPSVEEQ